MQPPISPTLRAWYRWKSLRLPWRRKFLVGLDLQGNTYWEFRIAGDRSAEGRWRRIVQYPRKTHYGDVKVPPAWHQWLRNTRADPPSIEEQAADVARQERMKVLAAQADARWAAKASLTEPAPQAPGQTLGQPLPALGRDMADGTGSEKLSGRVPKENTGQTAEEPNNGGREDTWRKMQREATQVKGPDPWKKGAPTAHGETWQPKAWQPTPKR
ncbi:hypothetical protein QBC47DRAFT_379266 [Echria macrotheca]|uniref:NADH dehydrogenase [ubiquinone] 1 alpha subcomplex subunit n=1 Tax=Echria macrotheca TaxID=438768 RepID=A0AAJ0BG19_9PEZI|nr:hypothetical protein QBC47DRAFT_379266 [Echria macrotheca]